jgi:hypothetical protein
MRASLARISADRISSAAVLLAGLSCGALVFFVGLPLARSSPFPTPADAGGMSVHQPTYRRASLLPVPTVAAAAIRPKRPVEWEAMMPNAGILELPVIEAALAPAPAASAEPGHVGSIARHAEPATARAAPPAKKAGNPMDVVDAYLWEVYQRQPVKRDSTGDFTWKDPKAAMRFGVSMPAYVIGGMDRDFREQLYHAGHAMDAAGLRWSILSAFRDDYRQALASGFKARPGNSLHGGSRAVGGYGHGRAVDVMDADGNHAAVWRWLDRHGAKYGLSRPMPGADPAHIQPRYNWRAVAVALRETRIRTAAAADRDDADKTAGVTKVAKAAR